MESDFVEMKQYRWLVLTSSLFLSACAVWPEPDLQRIYSRSASTSYPERNPVIVIPGIPGSKLVDEETGRTVWGAFGGGYANPRKPDGARLLALPMRKGADLRDLKDDVWPAGVVDLIDVRLLGLQFEVRAYHDLLVVLGAGGFRNETLGLSGAVDYGDEHFTCFQFDYDWRRDTVENVERLHRFILEKRAYVERELEERFAIENPQVKFDLVAHSAGGLLARYYLRYGDADLPDDGSLPELTWAGARLVERAILIGTPNAGSLSALDNLVYGRPMPVMTPSLPAAVLGTYPLGYQVLPRGRHGVLVDASDPEERIENLFDPELWKRMEWGLASPEQDEVLSWLFPDVSDPDERREVALDHQRKCLERAERIARALDVPASPPEGLELCLFAGDAERTESVMGVHLETGELETLETAPGDGTVLRTSALMDERVGGEWSARLVSPIAWSKVTFICNDHMGLTRDPAFVDNILYLLLESRR